VAAKRIDLAIAAAGRAGHGLDIVGDGPERRRLEAIAGPDVRFLGRLTDAEARERLARCTALVMPGREDFGLVAVEAQASGRPPIVLAQGGALDSVTDGVSGIHVHAPDPDAFAAAMRRVAADDPIPAPALVAAARRFDTPVFLDGIGRLLADALEARRTVPSGSAEPVGA
jgi:glycosyltransferase involved in cell wall biosynthesis